MGSPFVDESGDLYRIDTKQVAEDKIVDAVRGTENIDKQQYEAFVAERLISDKPITDPIKKNKLWLSSSQKQNFNSPP